MKKIIFGMLILILNIDIMFMKLVPEAIGLGLIYLGMKGILQNENLDRSKRLFSILIVGILLKSIVGNNFIGNFLFIVPFINFNYFLICGIRDSSEKNNFYDKHIMKMYKIFVLGAVVMQIDYLYLPKSISYIGYIMYYLSFFYVAFELRKYKPVLCK